jgi:hypothetical protein
MRVYVSRADIEAGRRGNPLYCPVARAVSRANPIVFVKVGSNVLRMGGHVYSAGALARKFIREFDAGRKVSPQTLWFREIRA